MLRFLFILLFLSSFFPALGQVRGRATYQFLNLVNNPRQAALGGKVVTNYDYDPTQGLFNPPVSIQKWTTSFHSIIRII